jgi:FAD binding domain
VTQTLDDAPVLIVGGGPVGLSASLLLSRHGLRSSEVSEQLGIPIDTHVIGPAEPLVDETGECAALYGIGPEGAVLVRPDGHVAWRTQAPASEENLESAMRSILDRRTALCP